MTPSSSPITVKYEHELNQGTGNVMSGNNSLKHVILTPFSFLYKYELSAQIGIFSILYF